MKRHLIKLTRLIPILFGILICSSCINELPFESSPISESINISGILSDEMEKQSIVIRNVLGLTSESATIGDPIENANVRIIDEDGLVYELEYEEQGSYSTIMAGVEGKAYQLEVVTEDGISYLSNEVTMPRKVGIDNITTSLVNNEFINTNGSVTDNLEVEVSLNNTLLDNGAPVNAIYRVSGIYQFMEEDIRISPPLRTCYVTQNFDFGNLVVLAGKDLPDAKIFGRKLYSSDYDYRFRFNFAFVVRQFVIDDTTYDYWKKIEIINSEKTSLFSPPPGRVESNIKCVSDPEKVAYGYFTVGAKSEKIAFTNSTEIGITVADFCRTFGFNDRPDQCIDCRLLNNSTIIKPSFWPI